MALLAGGLCACSSLGLPGVWQAAFSDPPGIFKCHPVCRRVYNSPRPLIRGFHFPRVQLFASTVVQKQMVPLVSCGQKTRRSLTPPNAYGGHLPLCHQVDTLSSPIIARGKVSAVRYSEKDDIRVTS